MPIRTAWWSLLILALLGAPSTGYSGEQSEHEGYMAAGDSVPFGFNPLLDPRDPNNFVGYPEQVRDEVGFETERNTACPGETSGGFLSNHADDNGCRAFRSVYPLHDGFHPHETQIFRSAIYLLLHRDTEVVTVMLGANDLFLLQRACQGDPLCIFQGLPGTLQTLGTNIGEIYHIYQLVGFHGTLVGVQYYSTDYRDPLVTGAVGAMNQVIADVTHSFGGRVADAFTLFRDASAPFGGDPCAAGLLIALPSGGCDIHPSEAGRNLLANAVESAIAG